MDGIIKFLSYAAVFFISILGIYIILFTGTSAVVRAWFISKQDVFVKSKKKEKEE